jgi:hypothetical protein
MRRGDETRRESRYERRLEPTELWGGRLFRGTYAGSVWQRAQASAKMPGPYAVCVIGPV